MKPLRAAATTSQPVLTLQQIETIFFKVPELHDIHKDFYSSLLPRVQQWSQQQRVGDLFQKLVSVCGVCVCLFGLIDKQTSWQSGSSLDPRKNFQEGSGRRGGGGGVSMAAQSHFKENI